MENYFTEKMITKSNSELQSIIDNKKDFEEDAYIAAIEELEKRNLATVEVSAEKDNIIRNRIIRAQEIEKEKEAKQTGRKKAFKEMIELLKPSGEYIFTPLIVYLNIAIYIIMVVSGVHPIEPSVESLINWGGNLREITLNGQQWRLLTSVFLHGGLFHLLLNMYALLNIGGLLEPKFGKNRYLFTYIVTGLISSMASIGFNDNIVSIGASGAIFGMYGLFLSLLISKGINIPKESRNNLTSSILFFIGYNLLYGFTREGIDNAAHIGGLVSGLIIGFAYYPSFKQPGYSRFISIGISVVLIVSIVVLPKVFSNKAGEFQDTMKKFIAIEEKAMWMYREDLSHIPNDKIQFYYDKLSSDGIDLWQDNVELLKSLTDLPPYLQERVDILTAYCDLRIQACQTMQSLLKYDRPSDEEKINTINQSIEKIINDLQKLNE